PVTVTANGTHVNTTVPENVTDDITLIIDGNETIYTGNNLTNTTITTSLENVTPGLHNLTVVVRDENGTEYEINMTIDVDKKPADMEVKIPEVVLEGVVPEIVVTLPEDAEGNITVMVDGVEYTVVPVTGGNQSIPIENLPNGVHTIDVVYSGDDWYEGENKTGTLNMDPITVDSNGTDIVITVPENVTGDIAVIIDGNETIFNGTGLTNTTIDIPLDNITPGPHNVTVVVTGQNGTELETNETIDVDKKPATMDVEIPEKITEGDSPEIVVTLPEDATGNVTVTLDDGRQFTAPVDNGTARVKVDNIPAGNHTMDIAYSGDDKYKNLTESRNITAAVRGIGTVIIVERDFTRVSTDFNAGERGDYFYAILKDEFGNLLVNKTVQIAVNGPIYTVQTDSQGRAAIMINLRVATAYTYALFFQGDEQYNASYIGSARLTVTKKATYLTASNQAFKSSAKTKTVTVSLSTDRNPYDNKVYMRSNLPVTLTINGKTYNARTDANGNVKFNIGDQTKKGTYNAVIKYAGDQGYEAVSKTIKITIGDSTSTSGATTTKSSVTPYTPGGNYSSTEAGTPTGNNVPTKKNTYIEVVNEFTRAATDYNAGERGDYFYAVLKDSDGNVLANKTVQVGVNGPIYTVKTDSQGRAAIMINLASANTYTYALVFSGDDEYNAAPLACSKLIITKKPITITAKDQTFKASAKTKTVTATLSTSKNQFDGKTYLNSGKKVTLKVDGKTYNGYIDSKGKVSFNVQLTKKGTYSASISFDGDRTYESAT
ncbi:MAG: Ig-like domain repeat protein, partial [Erysipelotrichaceae bacterium]|nr:Ig-like domain repeat protein [Erysipelotrichaceae bacterium]